MQIRVSETVTPENFFPRGYLMANSDLKKAFGSSENAARDHYKQYGHREFRKQLTPEFIEWSSSIERKAERFQRFNGCFAELPRDIKFFPIFCGNNFEDVTNYESESAHGISIPFSEELMAHPNRLYADVGAGLRDVIYENCLYVEVYPSLTTDVVIEATCSLPFKTGSLDGIGCFAVLEHVREPWKMIDEFARVLKPGGKVFIDWPFLAPAHGYPSHYFNATREGMRALFQTDFQIVELKTGDHQGPDFAVQWILNWLLDSIKDPAQRARLANKTIGEIAIELPQSEMWREIIKSLDDKSIEKLSCGNQLIGLRNSSPANNSDNNNVATVIRSKSTERSLWHRLVRW
jgi:SAM-dependent methyltransferase